MTLRTQRREFWIDALRGAGILLVVLGHLYWTNPYFLVYIYSFHIPLFFFISGLLCGRQGLESYRSFIESRIRSRIVPYVFFYIMSYGIEVLIAAYGDPPAAFADILGPGGLLSPAHGLAGLLYANGAWLRDVNNIALWYLPCLFVAEQVYFLLQRAGRGRALIHRFAVAGTAFLGMYAGKFAPQLPWSIDVACAAVLFYGSGQMLRDRISVWAGSSSFRPARDGLLIMLSVLLGGVCALLNGRVDMNTKVYGNYFLFILAAFLGISSFVMIARMVAGSRVLRFIGRNSLIIFCLHTHLFLPASYLVGGAFRIATGGVPMIGQDLLLVFIFMATMALLLPCIYLLNACVPFIAGRQFAIESGEAEK